MRRTLIRYYVVAAALTLAFQISVRSPLCSAAGDCGASYAKAVAWSAIWPASWAVYLMGSAGQIAQRGAPAQDHTGFANADTIIGNIERVALGNDGRLSVSGWTFDRSNAAAPVSVASFYDGRVIFQARSAGPREDVTKAHQPLSPANAVVTGTTDAPIECKPGQKVLTVAANGRGGFAVIGNNAIEGCP